MLCRIVTDSLFELLMAMVTESAPADYQLSSVASACLLSLVIALGDTGKMLSAIAALLTAHTDPNQGSVQVSLIGYTLLTLQLTY